MKSTVIKIAISIILGFALLRFGYEFENDNLSIGTQFLGYFFVSYPFYLFFKAFIGQIIYEIKRIRNNKTNF